MIKKIFRILLVVVALPLSACVAMYTMVAPGTMFVDSLQLSPDQAWNLAPARASPSLRPGTQVWTRDGPLLDRIMIIAGVPDGQPLLKDKRGTAALPVFRANMLPNEIEELTESTLTKIFGEGAAVVNTTNLRPHRFGSDRGILFDLNIAVSDSPAYNGLVGAFIAADLLYLMMYVGAEPYYYEKHLDAATALITGAKIAEPN